MNKIKVPENFNYIGIFLMLSCNLSCSYCINHLSGRALKKKSLTAEQWINVINRLDRPKNLPVTLQGGEPSLHPGFFEIIKKINSDIAVDILTNLQFNIEKFADTISPDRLKRDSPYASIRVSYHPETMNWDETLKKILWLKSKGYFISLNSVFHPQSEQVLLERQKEALDLGIDFRFKEFLGLYNGSVYGTYKYKNSCFSGSTKTVLCKTSELLISPDGHSYRCHHDLYNAINPQGSVLSDDFSVGNSYENCNYYGRCNPCDVKIKNNRFQEYGHTSVDILFEKFSSKEKSKDSHV